MDLSQLVHQHWLYFSEPVSLSLLRSTWLACYQPQASFLMSSVPAHKVLTWTFFNPNVYSHCNMGATYSFPPLPYCLSWTNSYLSGQRVVSQDHLPRQGCPGSCHQPELLWGSESRRPCVPSHCRALVKCSHCGFVTRGLAHCFCRSAFISSTKGSVPLVHVSGVVAQWSGWKGDSLMLRLTLLYGTQEVFSTDASLTWYSYSVFYYCEETLWLH